MAWKTMCNEVELLAQYPEVGLAISDSSTPVPGYLFGEITAITFIEYGKNCKPLVNFLTSRLEVNKPLVGMKILKLLLHLVKNGYHEMIEEVKLHEVELKEAMVFHGPPDDFHGKTFYENIRKMAKELLEYVFSENKELRENFSPPLLTELTGYGSNASVKKLPGFGFSVKTQKSVSDKVSEGITNFVEKLMPSNDTGIQPPQASLLGEGLPQYKPLTIDRSLQECEVDLPETQPVLHPLPRVKQKASVYKPGRAGGGWDDSEDEEETEDVDPVEETASKKSSLSVDSVDFSKIELKEVATDWSDEQKLIEEFTTNEELNLLDVSKISILCSRCACLNCDQILVSLIAKLSETEERVQLRALLLIEYLLFYDVVTLESLLKLVHPPLNHLLESEENIPASVKLKAKKLHLIIQNLNKATLQKGPKQLIEPVKCNS